MFAGATGVLEQAVATPTLAMLFDDVLALDRPLVLAAVAGAGALVGILRTLFLMPALKLVPDRSTSIEEKEATQKSERIERTDALELMPCADCGDEQVYKLEEYIEPVAVDERVGFDGLEQLLWTYWGCGSPRYAPYPRPNED
jgi:hypothetical protein